ncbi:hypothetical protein [Microbacterium sp.]|uniref:hypothetical protein n=1 Tax=Microbacterium sp. TaxID=51671 RepID=UPI003C78CB4A
MKDILIEGHRILTTDEVADAVIDYARVLHDRGSSDIVEFPSIHDGQLSRCSVLLGSGPLAVIEAPVEIPAAVLGADRACAEIVRRADALR